jgi:hypothetical protein
MGTWALDAFSNDAAGDFLAEAADSPGRAVTQALKSVTKSAPDDYLEVDVGGAAFASCELVATAFGFGLSNALDNSQVAEIVEKLKPSEPQRLLALASLPRIANVKTSELAELWTTDSDASAFAALINDLEQRLNSAAAGPRPLPKAKTGDLILLPAQNSGDGKVLVQIVSMREVAVFEGTQHDANTVIAVASAQPARRVAASASEIFRIGTLIANNVLRADLKGNKRYASELGELSESYSLTSASYGQLETVDYQQALKYDRLEYQTVDGIRDIAINNPPIRRVRSFAEREALYSATRSVHWAERRQLTRPHPFGDHDRLVGLIDWINEYSVPNAVRVQEDIAAGRQGYGRPNETSERGDFAFCGIVAYWLKRWGDDALPTVLKATLPAAPTGELLNRAVVAAHMLATRILTCDAELRLMWQHSDDHGVELQNTVRSLQHVLGSR